ncbi:MAG: hypothetical protein HC831_14325 [Chloroflexia bacterium]|nr:hypothetical protein [Chloroflexia bacterium]
MVTGFRAMMFTFRMEQNKLNSTRFVYGEKFYLNFNDIKGFKKEGDFVFPGMQLFVLNEQNDTVMMENDLFENQTGGTDLQPLLLNANLTVAKPIYSNKEYIFHVNIWDKKGTGTFKSKMKFTVVPNDKLTIENNNLNYSEIYFYSQEQGKFVTDNSATRNEKLYLVFEGLDGFNLEDGKVFFGMKVNAKDSKGNVLINEDDLFEDTGYDPSELQKMLSADVLFSGDNINNPISCEFLVWDKRGENKIRVTVDLNLK